MISFLPDSVLNSQFIEIVIEYWNNLISYLSGTPVLITENPTVLTFVETLPASLQFDQFQYKLLKGFCILLLVNILLIIITWKIYGKRICERFMKPGMSQLTILSFLITR